MLALGHLHGVNTATKFTREEVVAAAVKQAEQERAQRDSVGGAAAAEVAVGSEALRRAGRKLAGEGDRGSLTLLDVSDSVVAAGDHAKGGEGDVSVLRTKGEVAPVSEADYETFEELKETTEQQEEAASKPDTAASNAAQADGAASVNSDIAGTSTDAAADTTVSTTATVAAGNAATNTDEAAAGSMSASDAATSTAHTTAAEVATATTATTATESAADNAAVATTATTAAENASDSRAAAPEATPATAAATAATTTAATSTSAPKHAQSTPNPDVVQQSEMDEEDDLQVAVRLMRGCYEMYRLSPSGVSADEGDFSYALTKAPAPAASAAPEATSEASSEALSTTAAAAATGAEGALGRKGAAGHHQDPHSQGQGQQAAAEKGAGDAATARRKLQARHRIKVGRAVLGRAQEVPKSDVC